MFYNKIFYHHLLKRHKSELVLQLYCLAEDTSFIEIDASQKLFEWELKMVPGISPIKL